MATTLQNVTPMHRTLFIAAATLAVLAGACARKAPSGGTQPSPNTGMRTVDSANVRLTPIDPPPMLTDEAPPVKTVTGLAQADAPPPPTPQDEALRASLPFSPAIAMDPIDGSKISIRASIPTVEYKNKLYYFANEDHKRTFLGNPEQYTKGLFSHL